MNAWIGTKGRAADMYYIRNKIKEDLQLLELLTGTTIPITPLTISGRDLAAS